MKIIDATKKNIELDGFLDNTLAMRGGAVSTFSNVEQVVKVIIDHVSHEGDRALIEYTKEFDGWNATGKLEVPKAAIDAAYKKISKTDREVLKLAASRIKTFHKKQVQRSWTFKDEYGSILGQKVTPIEKVGIYVPGGKAAYPSTVLMNAIPARIAGVDEIIMVTPRPNGGGAISDYVLAAAKIAGVHRVFQIGGAQAIAALAFGTETVPRVDKITGPGNIYVATAKRLVYGVVDIDMIAGPSEILIINDGTGNASWMAADLLSQAEHDELASSILLTTSREMAQAVSEQVDELLDGLSNQRKTIAKKSLVLYGRIIIVKNLEEAVHISNKIAPEHLELFVKKPETLLKLIKNAGAIFLGANTPEAVGDYLAGPNHTLPTGGTARFSSPLGVEDFIKRTSVIGFSEKGVKQLGKAIQRFAELEGLEAHGMSMGRRMKG